MPSLFGYRNLSISLKDQANEVKIGGALSN